MNPYQTECDTTGDVSEENREKIAEGLKGVLGDGARGIIDEFIEGRKLTAENDTRMFHGHSWRRGRLQGDDHLGLDLNAQG